MGSDNTTQKQFEDWTKGMEISTEWVNGVEYKFCTMSDGWIAIFEVSCGEYIPKIQASDYSHAHSYCSMIEPIPVPFNVL